jgi:hypothetical protein
MYVCMYVCMYVNVCVSCCMDVWIRVYACLCVFCDCSEFSLYKLPLAALCLAPLASHVNV